MNAFPKYDQQLSVMELTAIYNAFASKPVKKFSDKKTALARLDALRKELKTKELGKPGNKEARGVGAAIREMLGRGLDRDLIVMEVTAKFPNSIVASSEAVAKKHIAWHLSKLKAAAKHAA